MDTRLQFFSFRLHGAAAAGWVACLGLLLAGAGCSAGNEAIAYNLVDHFDTATVSGTVDIESPAPTEWRFDGDGTIPPPDPPDEAEDTGANDESADDEPSVEVPLGLETYGWIAFNDVEEFGIREDMLAGTAGAQPILLTGSIPESLADDALIHAVEIRMKISAGDMLRVWPRGGIDLAEALEEDTKDTILKDLARLTSPLETELAPGDAVTTYVLSNVAVSLTAGSLRRMFIDVTEAEGAEFEIESVRVTTVKEHLLSIPSGPGWQGLDEVYRETIVSRSPEIVSFDVAVPDRPFLEISYGTIEDGAVTFMVDIDGERAMERTVTTPNRWETLRVDLSDHAGDSIDVSLSLRGETKGMLGFWGTPIMRRGGAEPAGGEITEARAALADGGERRPRGVIFLIADTLRRDHLEPWGYGRDTAPFLTRLAAEGTVFADNISQGTWTKVSVPSIFTSLYPTSHGLVDMPDRLPSSVTTIPEAFNDAGYATLSTSSVMFTGKLTNLHQGVEVLHEAASVTGLEHSSSKTARTFIDRLMPWLEDHHDAPFFIFLHVFDPHSPFEPYRPYDGRWAEPGAKKAHEERIEAVREGLDEADEDRADLPYGIDIETAGVDRDAFVAHEVDWYDGSIRGMDAEISRLFERLREVGVADDTLLVFMSDHGEEFLEHGRHFHGYHPYGEMVNVPLFFHWPGVVPAGLVVDELVQSIDVMPTVLRLAGLPVPEQAQGQSLIPLMAAPTDAQRLGWIPRPAFSERSIADEAFGDRDDAPDLPDLAYLAVVLDGWKLVKILDPPEGRAEYELYSHTEDPLNLVDVAADHPDVVARLAAEIDAWQEMALAAKVEEESVDSLPPEELARLRALGYIR